MKPKFGPLLARSGGAIALLAAVLSFSDLALAAGLPAVPGQLIVRVPAGTTPERVQSLAAGADCVVVRRLDFAPDFYVLRLRGASRSARLGAAPAGRSVVVNSTI